MENGPPPQFDDDRKKSIPDLILILRSAYRAAEFDRIQGILVDREAELKRDMNKKKEEIKKERDYRMLQEVKYEYELKHMKEKAAKAEETYETLLEKVKKEGRDETVIVELRRKNSELESAKKRVEEELHQTKEKFQVKYEYELKHLKEKAAKAEETYETLLEKVKKEGRDETVIVELRRKNSELESAKKRVEEELHRTEEKFQDLKTRLLQLEARFEEEINWRRSNSSNMAVENVRSDNGRNGRGKNNGSCNTSSSHVKREVIVSVSNENSGLAMPAISPPHPPTKEKGGLQTTGGKKFASGDTILIDDSDDDCASRDIFCEKEISQKRADLEHSRMTGEENRLRLLKRKRSSPVNIGESESDENYGGNPIPTIQMKQHQGLSLEPNGSPLNHCLQTDIPCAANHVEKLTPSSHVEKIAAIRNSSSFINQFRQRTSVGKSVEVSPISNNRGFNKRYAPRFLTNGNPQGKLNRSVKQLEMQGWDGLSDCSRLAVQHSKQNNEALSQADDVGPILSDDVAGREPMVELKRVWPHEGPRDALLS
ncbi:hypothetical protein FNV43_RR09384 [Rhamnella rubrinervis]|uniref:Uncharacterized protein n=1 Tax=Rhamnella rubrinervis TaxID=2594499 RepID=A0A8K0MJS2_9ROSA|nr:hypothetical protein FNV43_RR09384 [Rhamnella rubrinervis]